jgi:(p)ppGpp synthase/HD superfamily hydrolase
VNHLLEVAAAGGDQDTIMAALLHDAIEGQEISREIMAELFSEHVAGIVLEVADDKSLPWQERRRPRLPPPATRAHSAKLIMLADRISKRAVGRSKSAG